jgi:hypothetical protein
MNIVENVATDLVPNPDKDIERKKFKERFGKRCFLKKN